MDVPPDRARALDELAGALRERLIADAGAEAGGPGGIRALVDERAALLDAATREELVARVAERSFGLGPLEALLSDPEVDEVMVNGSGPAVPCGWSDGAASSRRTCASGPRTSCATRSSGSWRRSGGASTRPSRCATRGLPTARG
jgi:hypothetical protein